MEKLLVFAPKIRTDFALRAAGVLGTSVHAWAHGYRFRAMCATRELVEAVAVAATSNTAPAAPEVSHRRPCIDYVSVTTIFAFAPLACRSQASATRARG
jgi:hypothetical protein